MDLGPLLAPRSIAVVGATDRVDAYGANVLRNLARAGFGGTVWAVNPRRDVVLGIPCFPAVAELREIALAHDLPVCGPNGNGIVAVGERAAIWGDGLAALEPGPVALVTQS